MRARHIVGALDLLVRVTLPNQPPEVEFPAGDALSVLIGVAQLGLIPLAVTSLASPEHGIVAKLALLYTAALWLGQGVLLVALIGVVIFAVAQRY